MPPNLGAPRNDLGRLYAFAVMAAPRPPALISERQGRTEQKDGASAKGQRRPRAARL